jgi:hypothetical protein
MLITPCGSAAIASTSLTCSNEAPKCYLSSN